MGETKTMTKYDEIRDLHPRVKHILTIQNWCVVNEARFTGGRIDFLAIKRDTGDILIVECKIAIKNVWEVIGQIQGYETALGVTGVIKSLATFDDIADNQFLALDEQGIGFRQIPTDTPLMDRWMGGYTREFLYWFNHWQHPIKEGSLIHQWMQEGNIWPRAAIKTESPDPVSPVSYSYDGDTYDNLDDPERYAND
jgi:hypothetical protein